MSSSDTPNKINAANDEKLTIANLQKVLSVNAKINSTLDLGDLLGLIMTTAAEVMQAETASLMLLDEASGELVFKVALGESGHTLVEKFRLKLGEGIGGYVAQTGEAVIVNDTVNDKRFARRFDQATGFKTKAIACVPMKSSGRVIGVLQAINPYSKAEFTRTDLELFETFADQAALAVERAKMHAELVKQERSRQELKIAHEIQQNFLPDLAERKFKVDIAARNLPALEVGGDFYDVLPIGPDKTAVVIGDVSGKGVPAALYMVRVISELRYLAPRFPDPAELLRHLNNSLAEKPSFGMFVTLIYVLIDHTNKTLRFSSAGHHPILLQEPDNSQVRYLPETGGIPLGMAAEEGFEEHNIPLSAGQLFLLYTDGVVEARSKSGEEFGAERLQAFFDKPFSSALECTDRLIEELAQFTKEAPQHDDTTALALRIIP